MNFNVHQQKLNWSNGKNCLLFFLMNTHFICFPQMLTLGLHSKHVRSICMLLCITCNTFSHDEVEVLFIFYYRMLSYVWNNIFIYCIIHLEFFLKNYFTHVLDQYWSIIYWDNDPKYKIKATTVILQRVVKLKESIIAGILIDFFI